MTEPYTPTTEEVRAAYIGVPEHYLDASIGAEFDRWFIRQIEAAEYSGYLRAVQDVDNTRHRFGTGGA